jgi:hypothetical protein
MSITPINYNQPVPATSPQLEDALRGWWNDQGTGPATDGSADENDLWEMMPEIDSKAVARTGPLFKEHLGIALDVRLIRHGGYANIEDLIHDLVPKMTRLKHDRSQNKEVA